MATNNFDQDDQQDTLASDVNRGLSDIQSTKTRGTQRLRPHIIGISIGSVLILSIIAATVWSGSRLFAKNSQPTIVGSIPQAANVVARYCNALVHHNYSQAQKYILPNSTNPSDLLRQEVEDAEQQNQGPLIRCTTFDGKDATYPKGQHFSVHVHKDKKYGGYDPDDPANVYTTKEVVSFEMDFFFQRPNAPTTYLTGNCQVLLTGKSQWLIYGSCPMHECPIPGWKRSWGIGPACFSPYVVGGKQ